MAKNVTVEKHTENHNLIENSPREDVVTPKLEENQPNLGSPTPNQ